MSHPRTFRLSDKAVQILDAQPNKTAFVNDAIMRTQLLPPTTIRCTGCGGVFDLVCFDKDKSKKSGRGSLCKNCKAVKNSK